MLIFLKMAESSGIKSWRGSRFLSSNLEVAKFDGTNNLGVWIWGIVNVLASSTTRRAHNRAYFLENGIVNVLASSTTRRAHNRAYFLENGRIIWN